MSDRDSLQVSVLYATQVFCHDKGFPKGKGTLIFSTNIVLLFLNLIIVFKTVKGCLTGCGLFGWAHSCFLSFCFYLPTHCQFLYFYIFLCVTMESVTIRGLICVGFVVNNYSISWQENGWFSLGSCFTSTPHVLV